MKQEAGKTRDISLDIIRIVATLAVVMIHCASPFVSGYKAGTPEFWVGNVLDGISRLGVPLFVMVSGSLFLRVEKEVTVKGLFKKNVMNIGLILIVWSAFYTVVYQVIQPTIAGKAVNFNNVLSAFFKGHYHLWYLYMTIGLYLITPFLRTFVKKSNPSLVKLFLAISVATQFTVPALKVLSRYVSSFKLIIAVLEKCRFEFFAGYVAYFLLGWYLVHVGLSAKAKKGLYCLAIGSLVFVIGYAGVTGDYQNVYNNLGIPVLCYSAGVFYFLKTRNLRVKKPVEQWIVNGSKLTFGVYAVHVFLLTELQKYVPYTGNPIVYALGSFGVVLAASFLVSFVLSKIPLVKTVVRG